MQELLSNQPDLETPLRKQEFYELRLEDSTDIWRPGFILRQAHACWSEKDHQMAWDEIEFEHLSTLEEAKDRYAARKQSLAERGFHFSDMEM